MTSLEWRACVRVPYASGYRVKSTAVEFPGCTRPAHSYMFRRIRFQIPLHSGKQCIFSRDARCESLSVEG